MPEPWERQPNEPPKAWNAFRIYRDLDPTERSTDKVRKILGLKTDRHIQEWCSRCNWVERVAAYDGHQDVLRLGRIERERQAASDRRIQLAKNMQLVGGAAIQDIGKKIQDVLKHNAGLKPGEDPKPLPQISLKDAQRLIDAGIKLERLESGLTTGNTGLMDPAGGPVKVVHTYVLVDGVKPPMKEIPAPQDAAITKSPERILSIKRKVPENASEVTAPANPPNGSSQERESP